MWPTFWKLSTILNLNVGCFLVVFTLLTNVKDKGKVVPAFIIEHHTMKE